MLDFVQWYYPGTFLAVLLLVFLCKNPSFSIRKVRLFLIACVGVLVLNGAEIAEMLLARRSEPTFWRVLCSYLGYVIRPGFAYLILLISNRESDRKRILWMTVPIAFNCVIMATAFFTHWTFWYDAENEFCRQPLGFTPFAVAGVYMILLIRNTLRLTHDAHRDEALVIVLAIVLVTISTVMESVWVVRGAVSCCSMIAIVFYYLFFTNIQNDRDLLTGVLLRRRFYSDAEKWSSSITAVLSIDLNDLKQINDTMGHLEGNRAIQALAKGVESALPRQATLYRTGGDEFMVLFRRMEEAEVQAVVQEVSAHMHTTPYSWAMGYAMMKNGKTLDEVCMASDASMYEDKIRQKGETYRMVYKTSQIRSE